MAQWPSFERLVLHTHSQLTRLDLVESVKRHGIGVRKANSQKLTAGEASVPAIRASCVATLIAATFDLALPASSTLVVRQPSSSL